MPPPGRSTSPGGSALLAAVLAAALTPSACTPATASPDDAPLVPPFTVSDHFSPTGYMGDGTTIGVVNMVAAACPSRAPGAVGDCYQVTYTPPYPPVLSWAGVYWQYPGNNWGDYPGHNVRPGATHVKVWAMGKNGGEPLVFKVGGIDDSTKAYHDSLVVTAPPVALTTSWQEYSVDLSGTTYDEVLGGFAWIVNLPVGSVGPPDRRPIVFYLDGITWSP